MNSTRYMFGKAPAGPQDEGEKGEDDPELGEADGTLPRADGKAVQGVTAMGWLERQVHAFLRNPERAVAPDVLQKMTVTKLKEIAGSAEFPEGILKDITADSGGHGLVSVVVKAGTKELIDKFGLAIFKGWSAEALRSQFRRDLERPRRGMTRSVGQERAYSRGASAAR